MSLLLLLRLQMTAHTATARLGNNSRSSEDPCACCSDAQHQSAYALNPPSIEHAALP